MESMEGIDSQRPRNDDAISEFRTFLPQMLASSAKNLLLLDLGMTIAYPTIVIPVLLNSGGELRFTEDQASWFGSIAFICQPLGSIISGFLFEPLGRKKAMVLVNIPHIFGWLLIYFARSIAHLYWAAVILGTGIGFMEAPTITYVGEISQPKWRGVLAAYAGISAAFGFLFVFSLGAMTDWRTAAAICSSVPMMAFVAISLVPESPAWLLSKGRVRDAEKSLCWLRGWVRPGSVREEFARLVEHSRESDSKDIIDIKTISSEIERRKSGAGDGFGRRRGLVTRLNLHYLFRRRTLRPLVLMSLIFLVHHGSGITTTRPFLVEIFKEFGTILDENWVTVISSAVGILGNVIGMLALGALGKRKLSIASALACVAFNLSICVYGLFFVDATRSWIPISLFILLNFAWNFGIGQTPWMLVSEIFPFDGRGVASGIAAAGSYATGFAFTKTYYDMHDSLTLPGTFGFFAAFTLAGAIFLYYFQPETEGKTLKEIEVVIAGIFDNFRKRTGDRDDPEEFLQST